VVTITGCVTPRLFSAAVDTKGANGRGEQDEARVSAFALLATPPVL
jgi:hypothetical protein